MMLLMAAVVPLVDSTLTENVENWTAIQIFDTQANYVLRDLTGQTGWSRSGQGKDATLQFQLQMELTQQEGLSLPGKSGVFWSMPMASSTPADRLWEGGSFIVTPE